MANPLKMAMGNAVRPTEELDPHVYGPYGIYKAEVPGAVQNAFQPAFRAVSQQFQPQMARARAVLGSNPAMRNSGAANKMNRLLLSGAYGQLTGAMGQASGRAAEGQLDLLSNLIQRRVGHRQRSEAQNQESKKTGLDYGLGALGAVGGAVA